jgi:hypothetical protein
VLCIPTKISLLCLVGAHGRPRQTPCQDPHQNCPPASLWRRVQARCSALSTSSRQLTGALLALEEVDARRAQTQQERHQVEDQRVRAVASTAAIAAAQSLWEVRAWLFNFLPRPCFRLWMWLGHRLLSAAGRSSALPVSAPKQTAHNTS